jgi:hypothetical protein
LGKSPGLAGMTPSLPQCGSYKKPHLSEAEQNAVSFKAK